MKKQLLSIVSIFCLLLTLAIAGWANTSGNLKVNIPFDFMIGKTQLKAGSYTININRVPGVPQFSSEDHRTNIFTQTYGGQSSREPSRARLVFHRYGKQYFLSQIWNEGSTVAMQLPESRAERELKHLARNTVQPEVVTVLAP
jgi:hypothetical protein